MRKAIIPDFPKKANGLQDLSSVEIELLAEEMAVQFCPDIIENPRPLDMDR